MKTKYKIELNNGHILVISGKKRFLIDVGTDYSTAKSKEIKIGGRTFDDMYSNPEGYDIYETEKLLGKEIDGLIASDILLYYAVTFDMVNMTITFSDKYNNDKSKCIDIEYVAFVPYISVNINGNPFKLLLFTGLHLSYLLSGYLYGKAPSGINNDFHSFDGRIDTETYDIPTEICGEEINITYGQLPPILEKLVWGCGAFGILGTDSFIGRVVTFDFINNKFCF